MFSCFLHVAELSICSYGAIYKLWISGPGNYICNLESLKPCNNILVVGQRHHSLRAFSCINCVESRPRYLLYLCKDISMVITCIQVCDRTTYVYIYIYIYIYIYVHMVLMCTCLCGKLRYSLLTRNLYIHLLSISADNRCVKEWYAYTCLHNIFFVSNVHGTYI